MTSVAPQVSALDPALFSPQAVDPETRAFNEKLRGLLAGVPPIWSQPASVTRALREEGKGPFGPLVLSEMAKNRTIAGPGGDLSLRVFVPDTVNGVYLHIHGGGFALGKPHHSDVNLENLARSASLAVVSVDYRLAPESPYPSAQDDCEAAAVWLAEHAITEFGSNRLLIGGESAGAHLSVATLLRMRDKHGFAGFSRANLTFGIYDLAGTPSARRCPDDTLVINGPAMKWFHEQFVSDDKLGDPDVSPLWADLRGLPAALFSVGTLDPLLDDSLFMYTRWISAGNAAELAIYPGGVHGFTSFPFALAGKANTRISEFLTS
jgi:acetyl esterase/lipase